MGIQIERLNKILDKVLKHREKKYIDNLVYSLPENQENEINIDSDGNMKIVGIPFGKPLTKEELKGKKIIETPCWGIDKTSGEQTIIGYIRYAK